MIFMPGDRDVAGLTAREVGVKSGGKRPKRMNFEILNKL